MYLRSLIQGIDVLDQRIKIINTVQMTMFPATQ
jgi:hypothetical protein